VERGRAQIRGRARLLGQPSHPPKNRPNPSALRYLWQERRTSTLSIDQSGVWRFRDLLPIVPDDRIVTLREGNTPLYEMPKSAAALGMNWLLAKHQGMNPTGSFKDTGMTAALSVAVAGGFEWVACASTGNTSAAMAAYAARAGLRSLVLIPEGQIAWGKLSQSMDYGATTVQLRTDFDGCVRVLTEIVARAPIYLLNSVNPYRLEGQKTPAFELLEQMEWQVPHHIIVPGGNLANCSALGKGFAEMKHLGFIHRVPKISIIQAEGANPLYRSLQENGGVRWSRSPRRRMPRPSASAIQPHGRRRCACWPRPAAGASRSPSARSRWPRPRSARRASAASPPRRSRSPA
jgi:threonine synthase